MVFALISDWFGLRAIAAALGRPPSTVSREVARNCTVRQGYRAGRAGQKATERARRPKTAKLAGKARLRDVMQQWLGWRWPPEQITAMLRVEYPDDPEICRAGALRRELTACLRPGAGVAAAAATPE